MKIENLKLKISQRGFTIVELLVVMAIAAVMMGLGLFLSADFYRSSSFQSEDEILTGNPSFTFSGPTEIVFTQLSGESTANGNLIITNGIKTATISFNSEGLIDW